MKAYLSFTSWACRSVHRVTTTLWTTRITLTVLPLLTLALYDLLLLLQDLISCDCLNGLARSIKSWTIADSLTCNASMFNTRFRHMKLLLILLLLLRLGVYCFRHNPFPSLTYCFTHRLGLLSRLSDCCGCSYGYSIRTCWCSGL